MYIKYGFNTLIGRLKVTIFLVGSLSCIYQDGFNLLIRLKKAYFNGFIEWLYDLTKTWELQDFKNYPHLYTIESENTIKIHDDIPEYVKKWGFEYRVPQGKAQILYDKDPEKALKEYPEFAEFFKPKKKNESNVRRIF